MAGDKTVCGDGEKRDEQEKIGEGDEVLKVLGEKWMRQQALRKVTKTAQAVSFPIHATSIQRVLVIMPRDLRLIEAAHEFINQLREQFPYWQVQIFDVDKLPPEKLNWLGVPRKGYVREIKNQQYDMVIDLNQQVDWLITYLAVMSGAPYRVHLESANGEFFNIQFKANASSPFAGLVNAFKRLFITTAVTG